MDSITSQPKVKKAILKTVKCSKKNCKDPNQNPKLKLLYLNLVEKLCHPKNKEGLKAISKCKKDIYQKTEYGKMMNQYIKCMNKKCKPEVDAQIKLIKTLTLIQLEQRLRLLKDLQLYFETVYCFEITTNTKSSKTKKAASKSNKKTSKSKSKKRSCSAITQKRNLTKFLKEKTKLKSENYIIFQKMVQKYKDQLNKKATKSLYRDIQLLQKMIDDIKK